MWTKRSTVNSILKHIFWSKLHLTFVFPRDSMFLEMKSKLASSKRPFCFCLYGAGNNCLLAAPRDTLHLSKATWPPISQSRIGIPPSYITTRIVCLETQSTCLEMSGCDTHKRQTLLLNAPTKLAVLTKDQINCNLPLPCWAVVNKMVSSSNKLKAEKYIWNIRGNTCMFTVLVL